MNAPVADSQAFAFHDTLNVLEKPTRLRTCQVNCVAVVVPDLTFIDIQAQELTTKEIWILLIATASPPPAPLVVKGATHATEPMDDAGEVAVRHCNPVLVSETVKAEKSFHVVPESVEYFILPRAVRPADVTKKHSVKLVLAGMVAASCVRWLGISVSAAGMFAGKARAGSVASRVKT